MHRLGCLLIALLLCGCAAEAKKTPPAIATPGPVQQTQIRGLFRGEDEPAEVVELDSEHGCWAYRTDTLGIAAEFREDDFTGGTAAWCQAEIAWKNDDPLRLSAAQAGSVLFLSENARLTLVEDGAIMAADDVPRQRAGYGVLPDGGYIAIAVSGRYEGESAGLTAEELAGLFLDAGCEYAVQLSEGPSAHMVFMGVRLNDPLDGSEPQPADSGAAWGSVA